MPEWLITPVALCWFPKWPLPIGLFQMWGTPWWQNTFMELIFFFCFQLDTFTQSPGIHSQLTATTVMESWGYCLLREITSRCMRSVPWLRCRLPRGLWNSLKHPHLPPPTEAARPLECSSVPSETAVLGGAGIITHSNDFALIGLAHLPIMTVEASTPVAGPSSPQTALNHREGDRCCWTSPLVFSFFKNLKLVVWQPSLALRHVTY